MQLNDEALSARTTELTRNILRLLGISADPDVSVSLLRKRLDEKVNSTPGQELAGRIGAPDKVEELKAQLRTVLDRLARTQPGGLTERRNNQIEQLRLWVLADVIHGRNPKFPDAPALPQADEALVKQQLRTLELMVRDLVRDGYGGEQNLRHQLSDALAKRFKDFEAKADSNDILSGTNFSELAAIFLDKRAFPDRFDRFFLDGPLLKLLGRRQDTLRLFLTYANQARNALAHHKVLNPAHAALLELCFADIVEAVQEAHDQGNTPVNPTSFMRPSPADLSVFLQRLESREKTDAQLATIPESIEAMRQDMASTKRRLGLVLAGLAVVGAMTAGGLWLTYGTQRTVEQTATAVNNAAAGVRRVEGVVTETGRTADKIDQTTTQTAQQIQEAMQGDLLVDRPTEPDHHWHNFTILVRRNKPVEAEANLLGYVHAGGDKFDALLQAVDFLAARHERAEIRPLLLAQVTPPLSAAMRTALARLLGRTEAEAELSAVHEAWPAVAMPLYERARLHSTAVVPMMTNDELIAEHELLGLFLASTHEHPLGRTLQQPGDAAALIADATRREGNLNPQTLEMMRKGVSVQAFVATMLPWSVGASIPEPVRSLDYRIDDGAWIPVDVSNQMIAFSNMRSSAALKQPPAFGKPESPGGELPTVMLVPYGPVKLPTDRFQHVSFRYTDLTGKLHGPFESDIDFPIARMQAFEYFSKCEWVASLYSVRAIQSGIRCGTSFYDRADITLRSVRYSFNSPVPDKEAAAGSGLLKGRVELIPPQGANRFVYQLVLSDGTVTSARTIRP